MLQPVGLCAADGLLQVQSSGKIYVGATTTNIKQLVSNMLQPVQLYARRCRATRRSSRTPKTSWHPTNAASYLHLIVPVYIGAWLCDQCVCCGRVVSFYIKLTPQGIAAEKRKREKELKKQEEKPQDQEKARAEASDGDDYYMGDDEEKPPEEAWPEDDPEEPSAKRVKG